MQLAGFIRIVPIPIVVGEGTVPLFIFAPKIIVVCVHREPDALASRIVDQETLGSAPSQSAGFRVQTECARGRRADDQGVIKDSRSEEFELGMGWWWV